MLKHKAHQAAKSNHGSSTVQPGIGTTANVQTSLLPDQGHSTSQTPDGNHYDPDKACDSSVIEEGFGTNADERTPLLLGQNHSQSSHTPDTNKDCSNNSTNVQVNQSLVVPVDIHPPSASDKHFHNNSVKVPANQSLAVPENAHPQSASDRHDQLSNNSENNNGSTTIPGPVVEASDCTTMPNTEIACAAADAEQKDIRENVSLIVAVQTEEPAIDTQ